MHKRVRAVAGSPWLPLGLLAIILGLDLLHYARPWGIVMTAAMDEPAHLATAVLVMIAIAGPERLLRYRIFTAGALVASVAIDLDHLPLYAHVPHISLGGRPVSHSLLTVLVLIVLAALNRRRRSVPAGAAVGVLLHFVRDVATGPGIPLYWPISDTVVRLPYALYVGVLLALAIVATARSLRSGRSTAGVTEAADALVP